VSLLASQLYNEEFCVSFGATVFKDVTTTY